MPSYLTISMSTPASFHFLRNSLTLLIGAATRHLRSSSAFAFWTSGSGGGEPRRPRPATRLAGTPRKASTGCERSSTPLIPNSMHFSRI